MKTVWLWAALWGIFCMCFISEYLWGRPFLAAFGAFAGIFAGCWAMALAEILNVFPIFMRRAKVVRYLSAFIISMALGKGLGAFPLFLPQMVRKCAYDMKIIWGRCDSHESHLPLKL